MVATAAPPVRGRHERARHAGPPGDRERTARLDEILDELGWPGRDLVGADGASAAWVIAQHSDLDVDVQQRALDLVREAVADDRPTPRSSPTCTIASPFDTGEPQTYGTQDGCVDGGAEPADLDDPGGVDDRRAEVGLDPLAEDLADLAADGAAEQAAADG